ncbi:MAG: sialidase family protein [Dehalococcoidia bacterium]|nr:sialidase family protein [Dehalococcoidia bacterium]
MRASYWAFLTIALLALLTFPPNAQADDNTWSQLPGPNGGIFNVVALSPNYRQDRTVFAGSWLVFGNGVFKSTDGGSSWRALRGANFWRVRSIAISPDFSQDGTLFAATDWGVYRSSDGGESWTMVTGVQVGAIAVSPDYATDGLVLAGRWQAYDDTSPALYRSTDGGKTWT